MTHNDAEEEERRRRGRSVGDHASFIPPDEDRKKQASPQQDENPVIQRHTPEGAARKLTMKEFLAEEQAQRTAKLAAIKQQTESGQSATELEARTGAQEAQQEPPPMTLEAIAADPWNAVELPLPPDASLDFLEAAKSVIIGNGLHNWTGAEDGREDTQNSWLQALDRLTLINERRMAQEAAIFARPPVMAAYERALARVSASEQPEGDQSAQEQPPMTLETIAADPWNAVALPLPADAARELLDAAKAAAEFCLDGEHELMTLARAGHYHPPEWIGGGREPEPDAHEFNERHWLDALDRFETIEGRIAAIAEQESTTRQDAERIERSGEATGPRDEIADFLAAERLDNQARKAALQELAKENGVSLTDEQGAEISHNRGGGISI